MPVYMGARFLTVLRRELELAPSARCPYGPHPSGHCGSYPQCVVELPAPERLYLTSCLFLKNRLPRTRDSRMPSRRTLAIKRAPNLGVLAEPSLVFPVLLDLVLTVPAR